MDLFRPVEFQGTINKRQTRKWGLGVIIVCTSNTAIDVELAESYSTDSFLMALRRFIHIKGMLSCIQQDEGKQLVLHQCNRRFVSWTVCLLSEGKCRSLDRDQRSKDWGRDPSRENHQKPRGPHTARTQDRSGTGQKQPWAWLDWGNLEVKILDTIEEIRNMGEHKGEDGGGNLSKWRIYVGGQAPKDYDKAQVYIA